MERLSIILMMQSRGFSVAICCLIVRSFADISTSLRLVVPAREKTKTTCFLLIWQLSEVKVVIEGLIDRLEDKAVTGRENQLIVLRTRVVEWWGTGSLDLTSLCPPASTCSSPQSTVPRPGHWIPVTRRHATFSSCKSISIRAVFNHKLPPLSYTRSVFWSVKTDFQI